MAVICESMPLGVVVRKTPGVTRWQKWSWKVVAVLPGAGPADWRELRREGDAVEYHAATLTLTLYSSDTQAYLVALSAKTPGLYVIMSEETDPQSEMPWRPDLLTASAYEGQGYAESGGRLVELVPMPLGVIGWVRDFVSQHHVEDPFIKRKRDRKRVDLVEDGKGDPRIRQLSDVYRAPRGLFRGDA
jgi:hypothetical protein